MSSHGRPLHHYSYQEYLVAARDSAIKLEFADGEIHAMAGGSKRHNALALRIGAAIHTTQRSGCIAFQSDQRVRITALNRAVYPDVTVVCGEIDTDPEDTETIVNPTVIVEVLSPSTEAYDRGEKWIAYQSLPSLQEYVLVSQANQRVERYRRGPSGDWAYTDITSGTIELWTGATLNIDQLYQGLPE